ncbi:MAG: hypothetical protein LQ338_005838 [Usnochroma carphineum]|nr:MAG: hypothetical protein LQ338_005838 [Usnochroma carphineum]
MSPAANTQPKPLKRHRRNTKSTSISQSYPNGLSDDAAPRQIKSDLDLPERETEAKPPTMFKRDSSCDVQDHPNLLVGENGRRTQTPRKKEGSLPNATSPTPKFNSTPRPNRQSISLTPGKKNTTPSQAYAGPTFHASPAASSLPIPRFFSKSVPEINKGPSMQSTMEKETTEESSEQSEGSPTPAFARRMGEEQAREESPLDIFFKADKEQKDRLRKEQEGSSAAQNLVDGISEFNRPRHHSRHSTNGSMGAVFPMELENKEPAQASHEQSPTKPAAGATDGSRSKSLPSLDMGETPQQAEQRKAKTAALKKLLLSSVPISPVPAAELGQSSTINDPSLDRSPSPQQPKQSTSPQIYKQLAAQHAWQGSPCPRPSSNLRKEMSASALPDPGPMPELPATPTPSRTRNAYRSAPVDGDGTTLVYGEGPASPVSTPSKLPTTVTAAAANASPYKSMEDDLRRILKLNVFSSDGATGVRS